MCPHGYHHSGSMATPALGTRDVRLHIVWIALWSHQSAQTASSERCILQKVNVPQGGSPPNPRECSNCTSSERNIQRITMCPHGYHHSGSIATPALGTRDVRLHIVWIALWSHQSAQTASIYIYIFFLLSVLSLILFSFFLQTHLPAISSKTTAALTSSKFHRHVARHLCNLAPLLFFKSIWIASRDLECIMDFQFFLHNSKTCYPIFNLNTSICRSLLVLYFIFLT